MGWPARHISRFIARSPADVARYAGDPRNLPHWASGLAAGVRQKGDVWVADSPMGAIEIRFAPKNELGVLDHDVTVAGGETFHNPMRVIPNADGSEVLFTLYRRDGMDDDEYERDAATITKDLDTLRSLLEI